MTIDTSREAVERLLTDVTPGPWYSNEHGVNVRTLAPKTLWRVVDCGTPADARFIAAARELVPALLAERDAALAEVARLSTSPDALALVAAAYRDAANIVTRAGHSLDAEILARTPVYAQAALTAIERAAYERGVRDAAGVMDTYLENARIGQASVVRALEELAGWLRGKILALLTQEGW